MRAGQPKPEMDTTRYRLDPPPLNRRNDISAWRAAVENAHSQLEHQLNRCGVAFHIMLTQARGCGMTGTTHIARFISSSVLRCCLSMAW